VALVAAAFAYDGNIDGDPDLFHEGERLAHYDALRAGKLPFRDIFVPHGLGEDIIKPYLACRLLGPSLASLRRVGMNAFRYRGVLPPFSVVALLLATCAMTKRRPVLIALAAAIMLVGLCEITDRIVFALLAVAAAGRATKRAGTGWLAISGLLTGAAALYSFETGLYAAAAVVGALLLGRLLSRRSDPAGAGKASAGVASFALGAAVVLGPFLAWCAAKGILGNLGQNLEVQLFLRERIWPSSYPPFGPPGGPPASLLGVLALYDLLPLLPVVALIWVVTRRATLTREAIWRLLLAALLALAFWATVVGRADRWHVAFASPALILLAVIWLDTLWTGPARPAERRLAIAAVVAALGILVATGGGGVFAPGTTTGQPANDLVRSSLARLGDVKVERRTRDLLEPLVARIQQMTGPSDPVLNLTPAGLVLFLAARQSPIRFFSSPQFFGARRLEREVVARLRALPSLPRCVLLMKDRPPNEPIRSFLDAHYHQVDEIGPVAVLGIDKAPADRNTRPAPLR
jgi:hypothetical protein